MSLTHRRVDEKYSESNARPASIIYGLTFSKPTIIYYEKTMFSGKARKDLYASSGHRYKRDNIRIIIIIIIIL